jgi:hypothetical protein
VDPEENEYEDEVDVDVDENGDTCTKCKRKV